MVNLNPAEKALEETLENTLPASIDYRLRGRAIATEVQKGKIFRSQVCDAHPELLRAAEGVGIPQAIPCPICSKRTLVNVRYLFGKYLGPSGRCIADNAELLRITRSKKGLFTCYVVEVCTSCTWNFLIQSFPIQGKI